LLAGVDCNEVSDPHETHGCDCEPQGRLVCETCNSATVLLAIYGNTLIAQIKQFARAHRHWRSRWSKGVDRVA
jgi:hypothetical protein